MRRAATARCCLLLIAATATGCKARVEPPSHQLADASAPLDSPVDAPTDVPPADAAVRYDPEDMVQLLPIPAETWTAPADAADLRQRLSQHLVPLAAFLAPHAYDALLAGATEPGDVIDMNPLADLADEIRRIPLADWFVVGVHFRPCVLPLPLPVDWHDAALTDGETLREAVCKPRVQLVAQRFGIVPSSDGVGACGTSDDKALHLLFDFRGTLDPVTRRRLAMVEREASQRLLSAIDAGQLTLPAALAIVESLYPPALRAILRQTRRELVLAVARLRDTSASGELRLPYGAPAMLPRLRAYLGEPLRHDADLTEITQNFASTGLTPGLDNQWVLASYGIGDNGIGDNGIGDNGMNGDTLNENAINSNTVVKRPLRFTVVDAQGIARPLTSGRNEQFIDQIGSRAAFDANLRITAVSVRERMSEVLERNGMVAFSRLNATADKFENLPPAALAAGTEDHQALMTALQRSFATVTSVKRHAVQAPGCLGCHVLSGLRERFQLPGMPGAVGGPNRQLDGVGPSRLNQSGLVPSWNLRALGYFGQAPSLIERVVTEAEWDAHYATQLMSAAGGGATEGNP